MNFDVVFFGRKLGALGATYRMEATVNVDSHCDIVAKLSETYEHIRVVSFWPSTHMEASR